MRLPLDVLIRWQLASSRSLDAVPEGVIGLHQFVNFTRPFVNRCALAVAIEATNRVFVLIPVGAVNLDRVACRPLRSHRGTPLGQPGLARVAPATILQPARAQP